MQLHDFKSTSIILVKREFDFDRLKLLFLEFASSIDFDLNYRSFIQELSSVTELYSPPNGIAFILSHDNNTVGCVGIREMSPGVAVIKRLYIRSEFKRNYFGRQLLKVASSWADQTGIKKMRLDPCDTMQGITKLCIEEGFVELSSASNLPGENFKIYEKKIIPKPEFSRMMAYSH